MGSGLLIRKDDIILSTGPYYRCPLPLNTRARPGIQLVHYMADQNPPFKKNPVGISEKRAPTSMS